MYPRHDVMTVTLTRGVAEARFPYTTRIVHDGGALIGLILDGDGGSLYRRDWLRPVDTVSSTGYGPGRRIGGAGWARPS